MNDDWNDAATGDYAATRSRLARGWNTWDTTSVLIHALLPHGLGVRLGLKEYYGGNSLSAVQIGRTGPDDEVVTLGPHAVDGSYTSVEVSWRGITVRVQTAHDGDDDLVILVEPLENQPRSAVLFASVCFLWNRPGVVRAEGASIVAAPDAAEPVAFHATLASMTDPYVDVDGARFTLELRGPVGISTGESRSLGEISEIVSSARRRTEEALGRFAEPEHAEIVRDSIAWNTLFEPAGNRVITAVSRLWNVEKRGGFAMFCWDAFFGALLAGVHSRDLAHANAIEMVRELTPDGFVPNVSQGTGRKTYDGSQPPVGSLVCWQLFTLFEEEWFLREVFPRLLSWNRWWWRTRRRDDLICPGSTVFEPAVPSPQDIPRIGQHFGATCESGLDGHPVFSDVAFDPATGMLTAYDVGLSSEYVADCEALADIADVLGEDEVRAELADRAEIVRAAVRTTLWDDSTGIYRNHHIGRRAPTRYLAPTSFYPMFSGIATLEQSTEMTNSYLDEPEQFGGRWPLPSYPRTERHDEVNPYWPNRVWPPMNFLVYLGLLRAGLDESRAQLAGRCAAMVLKEWREHRHIHENYSSLTGTGCDVPNSQPYLTWGALLSLIQLIETGDIDYVATWRTRIHAGTGPPTTPTRKAHGNVS